jgi:MFS family permease
VTNPQPTTQPGALDDAGLRRVVWVLSLTEITSWGVLYYAFPVLLSSIAADTGWSTTALTGAFSLSLVVAGGVGILVGRHIDRRGPRLVMSAGSALAAASVVVVATAPTYAVFLIGWLLIGVAMAGVLYAPAFAAITHWAGSRRIVALTTLTLVAGLASTVFAPLTAAINSIVDWRDTYLVLVVLLAAITLPAHWYGLRQPWGHGTASATPGPTNGAGRVASTRPFILLAVAFATAAFSLYAVLINLVPLFIERGFTTTEAAVALGLGGAGQVAGRLGYAKFAAHTAVVPRTVIVLTAVAVTTALLAILPGPLLLLTAVAILVGVARGIDTLLQATAISDRWGVHGFGRLNGLLTAPVMVSAAVAPFAGAALAEVAGGQANAFLLLALVAVAAAVAAAFTSVDAVVREQPSAIGEGVGSRS